MKNQLSFGFLLSATLLISGCAQLGKLTASLMTSTTADLSLCAVQGLYVTNLYPREAKTIDLDYAPPEWEAGKAGITVMFAKRKGLGFYKIDGAVTSGTDTLKYIANGVYSMYFDNKNLKPRTISITTKTGQKAEFSLLPPKQISLVSVNGAKKDATVDLTKDMELSFEGTSGDNGMVRVSMIINAIGIRSFTDIGVFKSAKTIKIPASAFKNTLVSASHNGVVSIVNGSNYVLVERFDVNPKRVAGVGASQTVAMGWTWMPVTVTGDVSTIPGFTAEGSVTTTGGPMGYTLHKPNAFTGKPLSKGKKFAIASISVRGTLYKSKTTTSTSTSGNVQTTTTTTQTWDFPKVPVEYWDNVLENLNKDVTAMFEKEYGITIVPLEKVTASPVYSEMEEIPEDYSQVKISRSYKNSKNLLPTSIGSILKSISSTFASDRPDARLMRDLGVDGLISVTVDLGIPTNRPEITLTPMMAIRITGLPNGYQAGPTIYAQGIVSSDVGVPFSDSEFKDLGALNKIIRKDDLMAGLRAALKEQAKKEKEAGYDAIWALQ